VEAADVCTEPILAITNLSVRFGETVADLSGNDGTSSSVSGRA
jgi:hypothetical protein